MGIIKAPLPDDVTSSKNWHAYIDPNDRDSLQALSTRLYQAAQATDHEGSPQADLLKLLSCACSMRLTDGAKPPFQPMAIWFQDNKRTPALEDFDNADVEALAKVAPLAPTAALRGRLSDVASTAGVAIGNSQWRTGRLAVDAYIEQAEASLLTPNCNRVLDEFVRGLRLLRVYAKKAVALHQRYWDLAERAISTAIDRGAPRIVVVLAEEIRRSKPDRVERIATQIETAASDLDVAGNHDGAARFAELASQLWLRLDRTADAQRCQIAHGESLVQHARQATGSMVRATFLGRAIHLLKRSGASEACVGELQHELVEVQRQSLSEFGHFGHTVDATDIIAEIDKIVVGPTLVDRLFQMTLDLGDWPEFDKEKQDAIESAQTHVFTALFETEMRDSVGTLIGVQKPFDANDPESVYQAMVKNHRDFEIGPRAQTVIRRSIEHIFSINHPGLNQVLEIVRASPIAPAGHEQSLARAVSLLGSTAIGWKPRSTSCRR